MSVLRIDVFHFHRVKGKWQALHAVKKVRISSTPSCAPRIPLSTAVHGDQDLPIIMAAYSRAFVIAKLSRWEKLDARSLKSILSSPWTVLWQWHTGIATTIRRLWTTLALHYGHWNRSGLFFCHHVAQGSRFHVVDPRHFLGTTRKHCSPVVDLQNLFLSCTS